MKRTERTRFNGLQDRVRKEKFLIAAKQLDNPYSRTLVSIVYAVMEYLEWPDEQWSIKTEFNGRTRYFYSEFNSDLGVILAVHVEGVDVDLGFAFQDISSENMFRFWIGGDRAGDFNPGSDESLQRLAEKFEDAVVAKVSEKLRGNR